MKIEKFIFGGFKSFRHLQEVPLAPITLLFGRNSAGKSSVIQAMALCFTKAADPHADFDAEHLGPRGEIDLGGYQRYRCRLGGDASDGVTFGVSGTALPFTDGIRQFPGVEVRMLWTVRDTSSLVRPRGVSDNPWPPIAFARSARRGGAVQPVTYRCDLGREDSRTWEPWLDWSYDQEPPSAPRRPGVVFRGDPLQVRKNNSVFAALVRHAVAQVAKRSKELRERFTEAVLNEELDARLAHFGAAGEISGSYGLVHDYRDYQEGEICNPMLGSPVPMVNSLAECFREWKRHSLRDGGRPFAAVFANELGDSLLNSLVLPKFDMHYIAPFRSYPTRDAAVFGEDAAYAALIDSKNTREAVNRALEKLDIPYRAEVVRFFTEDDLKAVLRRIQETPADIGAMDGVLEGEGTHKAGIQFRDTRTGLAAVPRDVGVGLSQLIPIVVQACRDDWDGICFVQQPELHVHPSLQADLANLFADSVRFDRSMVEASDGDAGEPNSLPPPRPRFWVIETHSEHLMLRLLRLVRDGNLHPSDLSICVVEQDSSTGESRVASIPVDEAGQFRAPWPGGFFPERLREIL